MEILKDTQPAINTPSLYGLKCPKCHAKELKIISEKGSSGKIYGLAFGGIGSLVAESISTDDILEFQCKYCHKKFSSSPLAAQSEEMLSEPCTINFERMPVTGLFGFTANHFVWLNGIKVNIVKNGKTLTFQTIIKNNTLFVTDPYGFAFDCVYNFEAHPGGSIDIKFNGKRFLV